MRSFAASAAALAGLVSLGFLVLVSSALYAQDNVRHEYAKAKRDQRDLLDNILEIERKLVAVEQDLLKLQETADEHEQSRIRHSDELAAAQASLDRLQEDIGARARALYRINRRGFARIVFSAEDPGDLRKTGRYLEALLNEDDARTQKVVEQLNIKEAALERIQTDRSALSALQAELRLKEADLVDQQAKMATAKADVETRLGLAEAAMQVRERGRTQLTDRLPQQSATPSPASETQASSPTQPEAQSTSFAQQQGSLPWPTTGSVMRGFGRSENPTNGTREQNDGIDIKAAFGTPVRAVADGVVNHTGYVDGFGLVVVLEHDSYATVYAHLGRIQVSRGASVDQGDPLGLVGETGVIDGGGPRLHFEVRYHQSPQNPLQWLRSRGGSR